MASTRPETSTPLLQVRGLSKTFPGLKALDEVSVEVHSGEIVALVGQNGSGKSTLVKVLAGLYDPDPGAHIELETEAGSAEETELHFIHQDLGLVGMLSTVENLDLDRQLGRSGLLPVRSAGERRRAEELIAGFGASFDVEVPVAELSAAERAIVVIARALDGWTHSRNVLVLDEPTAALHGEEVSKLFGAVRRVAERGAGVVFISHRLDELIELADQIVVVRDGRVVADVGREAVDHDQLVRLIAGGDFRVGEAKASEAGAPVLSAQGLRGPTIAGIDLELRGGEILGVSGVLGSGREQLASIIFGVNEGEASELRIDGRLVAPLTPRSAVRRGIAYLPGDRHRHGAVMSMSARENVTLPRLSSFRRMFRRLDRRAERGEVRRWMKDVAVHPPEPERALNLFSGGNQQKVVLAKWLRNDPKVLLLDEPTQGVDAPRGRG